MIIKTFFDNSGAIQMKFDVLEERIYIAVARPLPNQSAKSKYDWKNSLVFTLSTENYIPFLAEIKQVLDGKMKNTSVLSYNTPNAKKGMAFGERQASYSLLIFKDKDKIMVNITKPNVIQMCHYIQTFFQNNLIVRLIIDALSTSKSSQQTNPSQQTSTAEVEEEPRPNADQDTNVLSLFEDNGTNNVVPPELF
jgi:hypothetical protein